MCLSSLSDTRNLLHWTAKESNANPLVFAERPQANPSIDLNFVEAEIAGLAGYSVGYSEPYLSRDPQSLLDLKAIKRRKMAHLIANCCPKKKNKRLANQKPPNADNAKTVTEPTSNTCTAQSFETILLCSTIFFCF